MERMKRSERFKYTPEEGPVEPDTPVETTPSVEMPEKFEVEGNFRLGKDEFSFNELKIVEFRDVKQKQLEEDEWNRSQGREVHELTLEEKDQLDRLHYEQLKAHDENTLLAGLLLTEAGVEDGMQKALDAGASKHIRIKRSQRREIFNAIADLSDDEYDDKIDSLLYAFPGNEETAIKIADSLRFRALVNRQNDLAADLAAEVERDAEKPADRLRTPDELKPWAADRAHVPGERRRPADAKPERISEEHRDDYRSQKLKSRFSGFMNKAKNTVMSFFKKEELVEEKEVPTPQRRSEARYSMGGSPFARATREGEPYARKFAGGPVETGEAKYSRGVFRDGVRTGMAGRPEGGYFARPAEGRVPGERAKKEAPATPAPEEKPPVEPPVEKPTKPDTSGGEPVKKEKAHEEKPEKKEDKDKKEKDEKKSDKKEEKKEEKKDEKKEEKKPAKEAKKSYIDERFFENKTGHRHSRNLLPRNKQDLLGYNDPEDTAFGI